MNIEFTSENGSQVKVKRIKICSYEVVISNEDLYLTKKVRSLSEAKKLLDSLLGSILDSKDFEKLRWNCQSVEELADHYNFNDFQETLEQKIENVFEKYPMQSGQNNFFLVQALMDMGASRQAANSVKGMHDLFRKAYGVVPSKRLVMYEILAKSSIRYYDIFRTVEQLKEIL